MFSTALALALVAGLALILGLGFGVCAESDGRDGACRAAPV